MKLLKLFNRIREPNYLRMIDASISDNLTIIDVGSDDGYESNYILKKYSQISKIHLVEPSNYNLNKVKKKIPKKHLENIEYHNFAISNKDYLGDFYISSKSPNMNSPYIMDESVYSEKILFKTLSTFIIENNIVSPILIMMDIEGQEVEVLEGLLNVIDQIDEIKILMEVHPHHYNSIHSLEKILSLYFENNFNPLLIESAGSPTPEKFKEKSMVPIIVNGNRALYQKPSKNFVLRYACHPHENSINYDPWVTKKIVRSVLIEKN
jgi:FkbM family methyltransferase